LAAVPLRQRAIRLLARREYARSELRQKLIATGAPPDEIGRLLDELVAERYLSDARYAEATLLSKGGVFGRRRIVAGLQAKGVARADIDSALANAPLDDDTALRALWQRRFGRAPVDARDKARQVRFLQARGFALSSILRLLHETAKGGSE
jgi:regulatory protein